MQKKCVSFDSLRNFPIYDNRIIRGKVGNKHKFWTLLKILIPWVFSQQKRESISISFGWAMCDFFFKIRHNFIKDTAYLRRRFLIIIIVLTHENIRENEGCILGCIF